MGSRDGVGHSNAAAFGARPSMHLPVFLPIALQRGAEYLRELPRSERPLYLVDLIESLSITSSSAASRSSLFRVSRTFFRRTFGLSDSPAA